jgi:glycerol-3-phosphate dehydrogenase subunit B
MKYDVVIIGAGLSGMMAALSAAERGKRTVVVARGMGIITIFTGTIDVLGYVPSEAARMVASPETGIAQLIERDSEHPYAKIGDPFITEGISAFLAATESGGVTYVGSLTNNFIVPTAVGTIKPTALVSSTMAAGDVRDDGDVLIAGFSGLKDFFPAYMAHNISTVTIKGITLPHFRGKVLDVDVGADTSGMHSLTLARKFEDPVFLDMVADTLFHTARDGERVAFPAVLGLRTHKEIHRSLEAAVGTKVFETPTLPPSVGGYRLFHALERKLRSLGVRVLLGYDVFSPRVEGNRVRGVTIMMGKRQTRLDGKMFVLATGGLVGRGIDAARSAVKEPIFGLPVSAPKRRTDWFKTSFFDPRGHPINKIGIAVDEELHPIDEKGAPLFDNLFVCGAQLAGFDALREKSGGGVAIGSGYKAGVLAGERVS